MQTRRQARYGACCRVVTQASNTVPVPVYVRVAYIVVQFSGTGTQDTTAVYSGTIYHILRSNR